MKWEENRVIVYVICGIIYIAFWKLFSFEFAVLVALGQISGELIVLGKKIK